MPDIPEVSPEPELEVTSLVRPYDAPSFESWSPWSDKDEFQMLTAELDNAVDQYQAAVNSFVFGGFDETGRLSGVLLDIASKKTSLAKWKGSDSRNYRSALRDQDKRNEKKKKQREAEKAAIGKSRVDRRQELMNDIRAKGKNVDKLQAKLDRVAKRKRELDLRDVLSNKKSEFIKKPKVKTPEETYSELAAAAPKRKPRTKKRNPMRRHRGTGF
jgi:hypothetical protein